MTVTPPMTTTAGAQSGTTAASNPSGALDKDGFLKLFIAQLSHQDPSSPMDTNESMQQMSTFSMVEQITNMANDNAKTAAVGMIGHTVAYTTNTTTGETAAGTVQSVSLGHDGTYTLTVDGQSGIDPTLITEVA